jgi:transposase
VVGGDDVLVAKGYRLVARDQQFLMPESMRDWLPASDPVWLVIGAVAGLDTSAVHALRRVGGPGRAGYDPDMLLTLLIWGWACGVRSSRVMERLCQRDVAFRIICGGDGPDHVTISRFRAAASVVMESLFGEVLALCARLGMGQLGVVALDSVKIASNASLAANRSEQGLAKAAVAQAAIDAAKARQIAAAAAAEHAATDAAEDALYGPDRRGDELPAELRDPSSRAARIAEALAQLQADKAADQQKKDTQRAAAAERARVREQNEQARRDARIEAYRARRDEHGSALRAKPPRQIRVQVLTENLAAARAAQQAKIDAYAACPLKRGRRPVPVDQEYKVRRVQARVDRAIAEQAAAERPVELPSPAPAPAPEPEPADTSARYVAGSSPKRNITDPQSRMMPLRGGGWLQGYNCQALTSSDGLIIATAVGTNSSDAPAFTEMMDKATAAAAFLDTHRPPSGTPDDTPRRIGVLLADAGYLSTDNLTAPGPDRLIAVGKQHDLAHAAREHPAAGPPPPQATPVEAMAHRLRTPEGHTLYSQRGHIAETPFGHAKHNLGFRRFTSRGKSRATAEFTFHALVHNLFKAITTAALTPATC